MLLVIDFLPSFLFFARGAFPCFERRDGMKKLFALAGLLLAALLCAGCNASTFDAERLLSLPAMNEEDAGVSALFDSGLEKGMQFVYPVKGKNRSPILRVSLGTSRDAGFLVFTRSTPDDKSVTLSFVISANQSYSIVSSFSLADTSVLESVDFADLDGDGGTELVVVSIDYEGVKTASVHRVAPGFFEEIFRRKCQKAVLSSLDGDRPRLFLVKKNTGKKTSVIMICGGGEQKSLKTVSLSLQTGADALSFVKAGLVAPGQPGLIIECLDGGQVVTRLALWKAGAAETTLTASGADIPVRQSRRACEDVNGDGILEIPYEAVDYYKTGAGQPSSDSVRIYEWNQWKGPGQVMEHRLVRVENSRYRFAFTLPEALVGKLLVEQASTGELIFYIRSDREPEALFAIVSMERSAFDARASLERLTPLAEDGVMVHALRVPDSLSDDAKALLPSVEQLKKALALYINMEVSLT